jgi:hypothetical protein
VDLELCLTECIVRLERKSALRTSNPLYILKRLADNVPFEGPTEQYWNANPRSFYRYLFLQAIANWKAANLEDAKAQTEDLCKFAETQSSVEGLFYAVVAMYLLDGVSEIEEILSKRCSR